MFKQSRNEYVLEKDILEKKIYENQRKMNNKNIETKMDSRNKGKTNFKFMRDKKEIKHLIRDFCELFSLICIYTYFMRICVYTYFIIYSIKYTHRYKKFHVYKI